MGKTYILDACAILALLKQEDGGEIVENIIMQSNEDICSVYMNKYNLLEVYYGFYRSDGEHFCNMYIEAIKNSSIKIIDILYDNVFKEAGRLKANYKISLADSIVLAEGSVRDAIVVSSDHHEFDIVEKNENIDFMWIR